MTRILRNKNGQNTAEYALLLGLVVAAAIAMQTYVKRNLQGGLKYAVDRGLKQSDSAAGQYEPYYLQSDFQTTVGEHTNSEQSVTGGGVERTFASQSAPKKTTRTGYQKYRAASEAD